MSLAKVSPTGRVTVPVEVRHHLQLAPEEELLFIEKCNGETVVVNAADPDLSTKSSLCSVQASLVGAAPDFGVLDGDDVADLVTALRAEWVVFDEK
jgi:bifunctional DNA-binding transcriptional regulator/antitoxin component of YhaV-PrlF toxin-antitoxin module